MQVDQLSDSILNKLIKRYNSRDIDASLAINDEEILILIKAARLAPSADNSQIWRFLILKDSHRQKVALECLSDKKNKYNCIIVALAAPFFIKHTRREHPFYMMDIPIAITHIFLMGLEINIHTDILFDFDKDELRRNLKISSEYKIVALLGLSRYVDKEG